MYTIIVSGEYYDPGLDRNNIIVKKASIPHKPSRPDRIVHNVLKNFSKEIIEKGMRFQDTNDFTFGIKVRKD